MEQKELSLEIKRLVETNGSFDQVYNLIIAFRDQGGTQKEAESFLSEIYDDLEERNIDDEKLDIIRDVGDYVSGWCSPEKQIWK